MLHDFSGQIGLNPSADEPGGGDELERMRACQLGANLACELVDELNFQLQVALLSNKVLQVLENEEKHSHSKAAKLRRYSRSTLNSGANSAGNSLVIGSSGALFPTVARTRSSSWISTQSFRGGFAQSPAVSFVESPLLDRILESGAPPAMHEVIKMMNLLTNVHSYCPNHSSVGGIMGATCTVADYNQLITSADAMTRLVIAIREMLEEKAPTPLISATVPVNGRLTVCGDTHGQLEDLIWVFFKNGVPSASNIYIFNGDIADRGGHALEIFLLLFLFKLNCYNSVHIIRGNHEDDYCNIYYGFLAELKHKFGPIPGGTMHSDFLQLFYSLPLACVVDSWVGTYRCNVTGAIIDLSLQTENPGSPSSPNNAVPVGGTEVVLRRKDASAGHRAFVRLSDSDQQLVFEQRTAVRSLSVEGHNILSWGTPGDSWECISPRLLVLHGGIPLPPSQSSAVSASVLLKHFHDLPHRMKIPPAPKTVLEQWMYQILWSDPQEVDGPKGRGTPFFHAHTKAFAEANNLSAIIRAHQVPVNQRGISFHHKQRLVTIFTASNYCGSSQNYGGVAIFTPQLFPELVLNQTLFEHWAPPLAVTKEVLLKHQNATHDVRLFIAQEIEAERAPYDRSSPGMLTHLEEKVAEYVTSLVVQHKRTLWSIFAQRQARVSQSLPQAEWADVCAIVIGRHFPWQTLLAQLEIDTDWKGFLGRFRAACKFGEPLVDTWEVSVVRGFFHELVSRDSLIQAALITVWKEHAEISIGDLENILHTNCSAVTKPQIAILCQALADGATSVEIATVFACAGEYVRSYFALMDSAPDAIASDAIVDIGRDAIDFFPKLRDALKAAEWSHLHRDPIVGFFQEILCERGGHWVVPVSLACRRLEAALDRLGLNNYRGKATDCMHFIASEENEILTDSGDTELSLFRFYGACYIDGTAAGDRAKQRISEHATAAIYFHRNALRCACVHLDKTRCGQIDRHSFQRAFHALNASVDQEWKLSKHQQRCAIEYLAWQEEEQAAQMLVTDTREEDRLLVIEYDVFLDSFEISDCQRMSRACSFGWHLVKDSFGDPAVML